MCFLDSSTTLQYLKFRDNMKDLLSFKIDDVSHKKIVPIGYFTKTEWIYGTDKY
jgi:hypothetical protein